jgi:xanthine dehydrogenase YagT iron-sulfur-binding subunit
MSHPDDPAGASRGVTRRGFLSSVSNSAVAVVATTGLASASAPAPRAETSPAGDLVTVSLTVNGRAHRVEVEPRWTLLHVLRDRLGLTGTKPGCERGECGACTVIVDGAARYACMTLAVEADGAEITTVEGLLSGEDLGPVQQAFVAHDAFQCGYCTSGQVMAVEALLRTTPRPTLEQIRQGLAGNLCRCGAYVHIFQATAMAAVLKSQGGSRG